MELQKLWVCAVGIMTCLVFHLHAEGQEIFGEKLSCSKMVIVETSDIECGSPLCLNDMLQDKNNSLKIDTHSHFTNSVKAIVSSSYFPKPGLNFTALTNINSPVSRSTSFVASIGAVGPKQYIVCTNTGIISFNKRTGKPDGILETTLTSFVGTLFPFPFAVMSNPEIRFDTFSQRWYIIYFTEELSITSSNHLILSVSDSPVIKKSTKWTQYSFQVNQIPPAINSPEFLAVEGLGIDAQALYIGYRSDNNSPATFDDAVFILQKASLFNGGPIVINCFRNLLSTQGIDFPRGVDNFDPDPEFGYFIGSFVDGPNAMSIGFFRVNNPGSTNPTLSPVQVIPGTQIVRPGTPSNPLNVPLVPHKGNILGINGLLDLEAGVFFNPHIRNNHLFGAIGTLVNSQGISDLTTADRGACFFYELDLSTLIPTVVQNGRLYDPTTTVTPIWYFMPTCMTNKRGDLIMGFNIAGENEFVNAGVVGRFASDPLGTFSNVVRVTHNKKAFNAGNRWGDYCHSSPDPDKKRIWMTLEYVSDHDTYAVQVTEWLPPKQK